MARFSTSSGAWSAPGAGTNGPVNALLALPNGDIIAGGSFTSAGDVGASRVARYSPASNTWTPLGAGVDGFVYSLALLPGGDIVAGGTFANAGGVPAGRIARYSVSNGTWSPLGSGVTGSSPGVDALVTLPSGDIVAGGYFTIAGGNNCRFIARYSFATGSWLPLGSGMNEEVFALALTPGGDVLAGGRFTTAGGVPANGIARYNVATNGWSALGTGVSGMHYSVYALGALQGGDAAVGGGFLNAGGNTARVFSRYTFGGVAPGLMQQPSAATACPPGSAAFAVTTTGTPPVSCQWQIQTAPGVWQTLGNDPAPLPCGGGAFPYATPINTPSVTIGIRPCPTPPGPSHGDPQRFQVRCVVSNACGSATSAEATYTICPAVYNCQNGADLLDIFAFLHDWFAGNPAADFNAQNGVELLDIFAFLRAWFAGC